jgi:hypothetical protein
MGHAQREQENNSDSLPSLMWQNSTGTTAYVFLNILCVLPNYVERSQYRVQGSLWWSGRARLDRRVSV